MRLTLPGDIEWTNASNIRVEVKRSGVIDEIAIGPWVLPLRPVIRASEGDTIEWLPGNIGFTPEAAEDA